MTFIKYLIENDQFQKVVFQQDELTRNEINRRLRHIEHQIHSMNNYIEKLEYDGRVPFKIAELWSENNTVNRSLTRVYNMIEQNHNIESKLRHHLLNVVTRHIKLIEAYAKLIGKWKVSAWKS